MMPICTSLALIFPRFLFLIIQLNNMSLDILLPGARGVRMA